MRNHHYSRSITALIDGRFCHLSRISYDHPETNVISSLLCPGTLPTALYVSADLCEPLYFAAVVNAILRFSFLKAAK